MNKNQWTKYVIEMEAPQKEQETNFRKLDTLTNQFEQELRELIQKYQGKESMIIKIKETCP